MINTFILLIILCVLSSTLFITLRVLKGGVVGLITKIVASFAFMLTGLISLTFADGNLMLGVLVCCGLLCGLIGDILLDLKVVYKQDNDIYLNSGMLSFGFGHIFYFIALLIVCLGLKVNLVLPLIVSACIAIVFTVATIFGSKFMKIDFGKFVCQSAVYAFLLCFVFVFATYISIILSSTLLFLFSIGLGLFLISDLILTLQYFGGKADKKILIILNHALYYAAQIVIASALFFVL